MSYTQNSGSLTPEGEYDKELATHQETKHVPILATGDGSAAAASGARVETVRNVSPGLQILLVIVLAVRLQSADIPG